MCQYIAASISSPRHTLAAEKQAQRESQAHIGLGDPPDVFVEAREVESDDAELVVNAAGPADARPGGDFAAALAELQRARPRCWSKTAGDA